MKKLTAIALATTLLLGSAAVSAAPAAGTIAPGETSILVPPSGVATALSYDLLDSDGNTVDGAEFSATGLPSGIHSLGDSLIIDGSQAEAGSFILSATGGNVSAETTVNVNSVRYFEDFEDGTVNDNVKTTRLANLDGSVGPALALDSSVGIIQTDSLKANNLYAHGTKGSQIVNIDLGTAAQGAKHLTIKMKIQNPVQSDAAFAISLTDSVGKQMVSFGARSTWNCLANYYGAEGNYGSAVTGCSLPAGQWFDVQIDLDMTAVVSVTGGTRYGKYSVSVDGTTYYSNFAMMNTHTDPSAYFKTLSIAFPVDDIMIYSGSPVETLGITGGVPENITVSEDKTTVVPFDATISPYGGVPTLSSTADSVTAEGKNIFVEPETVIGSVPFVAKALEGTSFEVSKNFSSNLIPAVEEDFEEETVGGNIASENDNLFYQGDGSWNVTAYGSAVLKAKVKGTGSVTLTADSTIPALSLTDDNEWHDVLAFVDTIEDTYFTAVDGAIISEGAFTGTKVTGVTTQGIALDDLYLGNAYLSAPEALNVAVAGKALDGETISADYDYFSISGEEKTGASYNWYLSDYAGLVGTKVSEGETFALGTEHIGQFVRVGVICSNQSGSSVERLSAPVEVKNLFTATKVSGGISFVIENTADQVLYPMAVLYNNGAVTDVRAVKVEADTGQVTCLLPTVGDFTGADVFVLNSEFAPLGVGSSIGTVPTLTVAPKAENSFSEKDGFITLSKTPVQPATLLVFNPSSAGSFKDAYDISNLRNNITASGESIKNYLSFIGVVNSNVSLEHKLTAPGFYRVASILKDGTDEFFNLGIDFASMFASNELKQSTESGFKKIIHNFSSLEDQLLTELYLVYMGVENKDVVKGFMQGEEFNMNRLKASIYLAAFLEDATYLEKAKAALKEQSLDDNALTLLVKNTDMAGTIAELPAPGNLAEYLEAVTEKAVLNGIKSAANYKEAKAYLEAVSEKTVTDDMALELMGTDYGTLETLKQAIADYRPDSGNGGSSGGRGGGVTISGSVSSKEQTVAPKETQFSDLTSSHWSYDAVQTLVRKGILNGYADGSFLPDQPVSRAELVKMICLAIDLKGTGGSFSDVKTNDWYYPYISALAANGIVTGSDGNFRPNDPIKREDAALILYRVAEKLNLSLSAGESSLTDFDTVSGYAKDAVSALSGAGVISGFEDGSFNPAGQLTRAQAATILVRTLTR